MFLKSLVIFIAAVCLSGLIAPTFAFDELELVKRIVMPACSGDANTPKPAICGQLAKMSSGTHPAVAFRRELDELARRYVLLGCSGDLATRPAHCSQTVSTGSVAGHKFNALRRSDSELEMLEKRYVNLRCSGDPAKIPADCFQKQTQSNGPKVAGHTLNVLQLRDELAAIELARRLVYNPETDRIFRSAGNGKYILH